MKRKIAVLAGWLLILWCSALSFGVVPGQSRSDDRFIQDIQVKIDSGEKQSGMENIVPISVGESYSLKKIRDAVKHIFNTGLFADIQVKSEGDPGVQLTFLLTRRLFVRHMEFRDFDEIPRKKLINSLFVLREGSAYSEEKLERSKSEIQSVLEDQGYFDPVIETEQNFDTLNSQVDILYRKLSAKKYTVGEISLEGDLLLGENALKRRIQTVVGHEYIPAVLEEDIVKLKEIYLGMDYQRVEIIVEERTFDDSSGQVALRLRVIPNEKINIIVEGADIPLELLKPIWEAQIFEEWGRNLPIGRQE